MQAEFARVSDMVKNSKSRGKGPSDEQKLLLYGLFKQATVGDLTGPRPTGLFDVEGKSKWDAWARRRGTTKEVAMKLYIDYFKSLSHLYL